MTKDKQIAELELQLKMCCYERGWLQERLDKLRSVKDQLIHLIETPTFTERLEAAGPNANILQMIGKE